MRRFGWRISFPRIDSPLRNYEQKIRVVMQVVADVYADLKNQGYPGARFTFETDAQGEPIVHLVRAEKTAQYYNGGPAFDETNHFGKWQAIFPPRLDLYGGTCS